MILNRAELTDVLLSIHRDLGELIEDVWHCSEDEVKERLTATSVELGVIASNAVKHFNKV